MGPSQGTWARVEHGQTVAAPRDERELVEVLHVLADRRLALNRALTLSRERLLDFGTVHTRSMTVEVGAGWHLSELDARLKPFGLTLGPLSPGAMGLRLSEFLEGPRAGLRAIPGGRLEPLCAGLHAVTADGRRLITSDAPRSAAGPDLNALVLGAHGRLALVTRATLRCLPFPAGDVRVTFRFPSPGAFVTALHAAIADGFFPWRVHVRPVDTAVEVEVRWCESRGSVERDRELIHRCVAAVDGLAGAPVPDVAVAEAFSEREATWADVQRALEAGAPLQLFRLALASVVVRGDVPGLALDRPSPWPTGAEGLTSLDLRGVLGGTP